MIQYSSVNESLEKKSSSPPYRLFQFTMNQLTLIVLICVGTVLGTTYFGPPPGDANTKNTTEDDDVEVSENTTSHEDDEDDVDDVDDVYGEDEEDELSENKTPTTVTTVHTVNLLCQQLLAQCGAENAGKSVVVNIKVSSTLDNVANE